ncbi:MAG: VWA domain-containing protein [Planctomycetes bacterium]|nr:VWA domain-containing protein [Planctomycetota bacterium]
MDAVFSQPAALWSALLIAPLLALYMLRHRPIRKRMPSVVLWQGAAQMQIATSPFQRLRKSLSLILLLCALIALVLALAGLRIPGVQPSGTPIVVVVDITASMQTKELGKSRLALAQQRVTDLLEESADAPITLLAWDGTLRPASPVLTSLSRARAGLDALEAVDYGAQDSALLRALRRLAEEPGERRIVLASDHLPGTLDAGVTYVAAGSPLANTAIVAAALTEVSTTQFELFFGLEHFGPNAAKASMVIERVGPDGEAALVDARDLQLTPGLRLSVTLPVRDPGLYRARLKQGDAFAADDVAYVRYSTLPVQDVAVIGPAPEPLTRAMDAIASATGMIRPVDAARAGSDAMFIYAQSPPSESPRLPAVYLLPGASPSGVTAGKPARADESPARPARHALWRGAGVPDIRVGEVLPVTATRFLQPLLETAPGPALALMRRDDDSRLDDLLVCMALGEESTGFAAKVSFVIFWENWFEAGRRLRDPLPRGALSTSGSTEIQALAGRGAFQYRHQDSSQDQDARPGESLHLERAGIYRFQGLAESTLDLLGVSLLDAEESNLMLAPAETYDPAAPLEALHQADKGGTRGDLLLYPWLALIAAALVLSEWFLFRRKYPVNSLHPVPKPSASKHTVKVRP